MLAEGSGVAGVLGFEGVLLLRSVVAATGIKARRQVVERGH